MQYYLLKYLPHDFIVVLQLCHYLGDIVVKCRKIRRQVDCDLIISLQQQETEQTL